MSVNGLLKGIRKKTGSASFKESKLGSIDHYIDTGCYALNRIVSGSIHKGIPCGRIILISGE